MGQPVSHPFAPNGFSPAQPAPFGMPPMMQTIPVANAQPVNMRATHQPAVQHGAFIPSPVPKGTHSPMDWNKVLMFYLFGLLPLLFIPCLLVPNMDFLRYAYLVFSVIGLCAMWYFQMFTPSTRATLSIVYTALCVVIISLLLGSFTDMQQTNASMEKDRATQVPATSTDPYAISVTEEPVEPTPGSPLAPGESEAEQRLITFMEYWTLNKPESMVTLVQPSWSASKQDPTAELFYMLANRTPEPEEYILENISGNDSDTSRTVTMSALINKKNGRPPVRYRFMIVMVKEFDEWYVDPKSLQTNEMDVASTDASGAAVTTVSLATPAPRTTITPVPPPETKLYFNPDNGKKYHADPNCTSVNSKFLPLGGFFLYSELKEYQKSYEPCLKCGAPTQPAD